MRYPQLLLCLILGLLVLSACGSGASSGSAGSAAAPSVGVTSAPAAAAPTSAAEQTPVAAPAAAATSAPAAGAASTATPASEQTPIAAPTRAAAASGGQSSGQIAFGTLTPYTDPQRVFTLNAPQGWTTQESSTGGETKTTFTDPTGNGTLTARVAPATNKPDATALQRATSDYLAASLGNATNLRVTNQAQAADGSLPFEYTYERSVNSKNVSFRGGGYTALRGTLIAFVFYDAPADQWATVSGNFAEVAKSYALVPGASIKK